MAWEVHVSRKTGRKYYFNRETKESVYKKPLDFDGDDQPPQKHRHSQSQSHSHSHGHSEKRKRSALEGGGNYRDSRRGNDGRGNDAKRQDRERRERGTRRQSSDSERREKGAKDKRTSGGGMTLRTSHILFRHKDSRNPKGATRTQAEATAALNKLRARIMKHSIPRDLLSNFASLAERKSQCSSRQKGGDLGTWQAGTKKWQRQFEEAAIKLEVYEVSPVFPSSSGVHIILRTK